MEKLVGPGVVGPGVVGPALSDDGAEPADPIDDPIDDAADAEVCTDDGAELSEGADSSGDDPCPFTTTAASIISIAKNFKVEICAVVILRGESTIFLLI